MTFKDLQISFEIEALRYINIEDKPYSKEIEYWLNRAYEKFVKTRVFGNNFKREAFEQTQKRIDDLRLLTKTVRYRYVDGAGDPNRNIISNDIDAPGVHEDSRQFVALPNDYMFLVSDSAFIEPINPSEHPCWPKDRMGDFLKLRTDTIEVTLEELDSRLNNTLSEHRLHRTTAKPLKRISRDTISFYTDNDYRLNMYELSYIKKPSKIDLHNSHNVEFTEMPEHTHSEIVKMAVTMFLENRSDNRYQAHLNEESMME